MLRSAIKMQLKPGYEAEYRKRHDEIWPQLRQHFKDSGVSEYSIFLDQESNALFAVKNLREDSAMVSENPEIIMKWWAFMADIMEVNPDNSPVVIRLNEVFYMK